ncbi:MAG TPA: RNA methyltransferase [Deltaproteobacteria bacterium]|nr:RNA methyltransferase [Deltaproteobacteria bacterium]
MRECINASCRMRFPVILQMPRDVKCPLCSSPTIAVIPPYEEHRVSGIDCRTDGTPLEALLDNIRSIYNVGSMFRTSDGAGISRLHLCGMTPTPGNPRLAKTALGAQETVAWTYERNGLIAARTLRESGKRLWALEGGAASVPLHEAVQAIPGAPIVLVVGNEVSGVDPGIMELCDRIVHIPMKGSKTSLNAAVAFGIAAFTLCSIPGASGESPIASSGGPASMR